mgnify:CR=1 FL=1
MENDSDLKGKGSKIGVLCVGIVLGFMATAILVGTSPGIEKLKTYGQMIDQCEISLPRSEMCVMIAVPKQLGEMK